MIGLRTWLTMYSRILYAGSIALLIVASTFYVAVYRAPSTFVSGKIVAVEDGETLTVVAARLSDERIVRSAFWLQSVVILFGGERNVRAGDYYFPSQARLGTVAKRLITGNFGLEPLRVTIPEGSSTEQIATIIGNYASTFDKETFLAISKKREGYLFPDTYFFLPNVTERRVVEIMTDTFVEKIQEIDDEVIAFGRPVDEVVTMASIVEREAHTNESRRVIAGILWKRIELGIPLQVDVTFAYINGKNTFDLTLEDLKNDSPYNTYVHIGLPPGPIANPGLDALLATVTPVESEYLFFLSDRNGEVHYSETFEEHKRKKALYLN